MAKPTATRTSSSMTSAGTSKKLSITFDEALERVPEALRAEGFGVLTRIDVQATLKEKLGVDTRRYQILGACNPPFAKQALDLSLEAGLFLPCNVVIYEGSDERAVVLAVDPTKTVATLGSPALSGLANQVGTALGRALERLPVETN